MKYIVLIIDGAAGLPVKEKGGKTSLEMAKTPHLDKMAATGFSGLVRTVPEDMEPNSAVACMSVMGYDPKKYYVGRASIEAASMGITVGPDEAVFRCNLVNIDDNGIMQDYSAGHIDSSASAQIINTLNSQLGSRDVEFYPGVGFRNILKIRGHEDSIQAKLVPAHDITGQNVSNYLPQGPESNFLRNIMNRSKKILEAHQVNIDRNSRSQLPATDIWLFWGSGEVPDMPAFKEKYGLGAAMTSGVDLLRGLAKMVGMGILDIKGVTDGSDNDNAAQSTGALEALKKLDLVVVHIEAPDEAGHGGNIEEKVKAIEKIDKEVVGRLSRYNGDLRVLVMPDHPTPVAVRTHTPDPVPFLMWGKGIKANGAKRFTEVEAAKTGVFIDEGYKIMGRLLGNI